MFYDVFFLNDLWLGLFFSLVMYKEGGSIQIRDLHLLVYCLSQLIVTSVHIIRTVVD